MISRILFIALEDYISVISMSEKGKSTPIPFDGEIIIKIHKDFWSDWCAQTSYLAPKNGDDSDATICDFCFVIDKDYAFAKDDFLKKVIMAKDSIWNVENVSGVLKSSDMVKKYHEVVIKMPNAVCFSVIGNVDDSLKTINATTNLSDMDYKLFVEEKAKQEAKKKLAKKKSISRSIHEAKSGIEQTDVCCENKNVNVSIVKDTRVKNSKTEKKSSNRSRGEDSPIVKYNKKLRAEEISNE